MKNKILSELGKNEALVLSMMQALEILDPNPGDTLHYIFDEEGRKVGFRIKRNKEVLIDEK